MGDLIAQNGGFTGLTIITVLFLLTASLLVAGNLTVDRKARHVFIVCLLSLTLITLSDWLNYNLQGTHPELRIFHIVSMAATFAVAPILPVAIAHTIFPPSRAIRWVAPMLGAHALFEVANVFGGFVFSVDATNTYHRGELYALYMLAYSVSAVYLCVQSVRAGVVYQSGNRGTVLAVLLVLVSGVTIQIMYPSVRTSWPSVSMAVVLYFIYYTEMVFTTDALTMLLNRHAFDEFLASPQLPCTIVIVDVDQFKGINDTYGHAFGDVCLKTIAKLLLKAYGSHGRVYRTGGDEFTVILTRRPERVAELEEKLSAGLDKAREKEGRLPTVSQGHAVAALGCHDLKQVIEAADQAMYETKRSNR